MATPMEEDEGTMTMTTIQTTKTRSNMICLPVGKSLVLRCRIRQTHETKSEIFSTRPRSKYSGA